MPFPDRRSVQGFTLIELMAALALTGLILLGARQALNQLGDAGQRIHAAELRNARADNGRHLMYRIVGGITVSDSTERVMGDGRVASFITWCSRGEGWLERCRATLSIERRQDSTGVRLVEDSVATIDLWRSADTAYFAYYDVQTRRWRESWEEIRLPGAMALVSSVDTLLLPVMSAHE